MRRSIVWCITGGGAFLRNTVDVMYELKKRFDLRITLCFSEWGFRVSRLYGVLSVLKEIASGNYMEEWLINGNGFYYVGRINRGRYDLLVVAPATSNTIAKMVYGVADTLPTLFFAEAGKSNVPVIVLPTDIPSRDGYVVSETPCYVDRRICKCLEEYGYCLAMDSCPVEAIIVSNGRVRIDYTWCMGCGICVSKCIYGAIKCWEKVRIKPRRTDLDNVEKLSRSNGVEVVYSPDQLLKAIIDKLGV